MLDSLPVWALAAIFAGSAAAIWIAGIRLSGATDVLAARLHLGDALGGLVFLAVATDLPELAITVSAAAGGDVGIAVGNLLGGVAVQTVVLAILDALAVRGTTLTYQAASLVLVLEGALVTALLVLAIMGTQLPPDLVVARVGPAGAAILVVWLVGVWLIARSRDSLPWQARGDAPGGQDSRHDVARSTRDAHATRQGRGARAVVAVFAAAALVTLVAGVTIETSGARLADHIGLSGVIFGATILAGATALPELSTGYGSLRLGDYRLTVSDIFGGNAFLPPLFLVASVVSGTAVLPQAQASDVYLTALGVLLTVVYVVGLIVRSRRQVAGMGVDSLVVLGLYALGILGLVAIATA